MPGNRYPLRFLVTLFVSLGASTAFLQGCVCVPSPTQYRALTFRGSAVSPRFEVSAVTDGRSRFREIFCALAHRSGAAGADDPDCGRFLWRFVDEPAPAAAPSLPRADPRLRLVIVPGAFNDCVGEYGQPLREAANALRTRGYRIETVAVSGRSSAAYNARTLAAALRSQLSEPGQQLVLLGYSKGVIDILHLLAEDAALADRVSAVISVAGPVLGSPGAAAHVGVYDRFLAKALPGRCEPGDGGVVDSLVPEFRREWAAVHPPPANVRFFSLAALPQKEKLSRALRAEWNAIARRDLYNDGQVVAGDAVIPGSTMLGHVNADHWGVAIDVEKIHPHLVARRDPTPFPQIELLEALLLTVGESIDAEPVR